MSEMGSNRGQAEDGVEGTPSHSTHQFGTILCVPPSPHRLRPRLGACRAAYCSEGCGVVKPNRWKWRAEGTSSCAGLRAASEKLGSLAFLPVHGVV